MRKMLALGAAIALCVGLGTTSTVGQDEVEPVAGPATAAEPVEMREGTVTGEEVCSEEGVCEEKLSDPRVSGTARPQRGGFVNTAGGMAIWGTITVSGPDGEWTGPYVGHQIRQPEIEILGILEGSDAYEGWTFLVEWSGKPGSPFDVKGVIYEGSAPEIELPS